MAWRTHRPFAPEEPKPLLSQPVELTAVGDGLSHRVAPIDYETGLRAGHGRYGTLCGAVITAASMFTEPGERCLTCRRAERLLT